MRTIVLKYGDDNGELHELDYELIKAESRFSELRDSREERKAFVIGQWSGTLLIPFSIAYCSVNEGIGFSLPFLAAMTGVSSTLSGWRKPMTDDSARSLAKWSGLQ